MHVPLLIRAPYDAMAGRRVADTVRSVDILPTVLELLGREVDRDVRGTERRAADDRREQELGLAAYSEAVYPRFHFGWSDLRALTSGRYKYVAAPRPELYDLEQDPGESHNIYPERQALGDRMSQELVALEQRMSATAAGAEAGGRGRSGRAGAAGRARLRRHVRDARSRPTAPALADPKDKISCSI